jgi:hypothetical protein
MSSDPSSSSSRTSPSCESEDSTLSFKTLPRSGMTRNGTCFELPTLVPGTGEPASGSLPTPLGSRAAKGPRGNGSIERGGGRTLEQAIRSFPTPTKIDATCGATHKADTKGKKSLQLSHLANAGTISDDDPVTAHDRFLFPTPMRSDQNGTGGGMDKREGGDNLRAAVEKLPTPTGRDFKGGSFQRDGGESLPDYVGDSGSAGRLNPPWVEWLMGFPTGWSDLPAWEIRLSRRLRAGSVRRSLKRSGR